MKSLRPANVCSIRKFHCRSKGITWLTTVGLQVRRTFEAGKWGLPVHGFNPIKYGDLTIEEMVKRIERIDPEDDKFGTWAEFSYVPFAYDQGGNTIFLSLRDSDYGSIYWFTFQGPSIQLIASSFEEFRAKLYHMPVADGDR